MNRLRWFGAQAAALLEDTTMNMTKTTRTNGGSNGGNSNGKAARPIHRVKRGPVEAAIWEREGRQGRFLQVSFERPYTAKDGTVGSSPNFSAGNIGDLLMVAVEALLFMEAQRQPRGRDGGDVYAAEGADPEYNGGNADHEDLY